MALIALITDTHLGIRKNSEILLKHQEHFFDKMFFPVIEKLKIKTIIHLGDLFDERKEIAFTTLNYSRRMFLEKIKNKNIDLHVIIGNHDCTYTNTNSLNSVDLLGREYGFHIYHEPQNVNIEGLDICFLPWITKENNDLSIKIMNESKADVLMGHLEIQGFNIRKGHLSTNGFDSDVFKKFKYVMSGHFHLKSNKGNVYYLGTPYEMTWDDFNEPKGFYIFDTDKLNLNYIQNKKQIFHKLYYTPELKTELSKNLTDSYIKVMVEDKSDPIDLEIYIKEIQKLKPIELRIIEDKQIILSEKVEVADIKIENTPTIISKYIDDISELKIDKLKLKDFMLDLYKESLEI